MRRGTGIGALAGLDHLPRAVPTEGNALMLRGLVWCCAVAGGPEVAELVAAAARACSTKLPDVGARSPKVLNACLWSLSAMGETGAPFLVELGQKARKPAARRRIDRAIDGAAGTAGVSRESLEVRALQRAAPPIQSRYFERSMTSGAQWPWGRFRTDVLGHPALSAVAGALIMVSGDDTEPFLGRDKDAGLADDASVRLWHPAGRPVDEVIVWRELLERERIVQPFKQAHREVYLLTPAERSAGFTSTRFAGHSLRQHTLRALADARGWSYRLQGPFDSGANPHPGLALPRLGLLAELVVEPVEDATLQSDHGIFLYVRTGGLTFYRDTEPPGHHAARARPRWSAVATRQRVPLAEIPARTLSEVLRDIDLFVSIAGVSADPEFPLRASEAWTATWREAAFSQLTPLGLSRRETLARILPALPIAQQLSIDGRFLVRARPATDLSHPPRFGQRHGRTGQPPPVHRRRRRPAPARRARIRVAPVRG
jgi:hypothetical protein